VDGQPTGQVVVKVLVEKKLPPSQVPAGALVPEQINGIPTDVHQIGRILAQQSERLPRPVPCGCEIGPAESRFVGTLGCLVLAKNGLYILSNNHVLANENELQDGAPILQPGPQGQYPADRIGVLDGGYPRIDFSPGAVNEVDAALALTSYGGDGYDDLVDPTFADGTVMSEDMVQPALFMNVHKIGGRTGHTFGQINTVNAKPQQPIGYNHGTAYFSGMMFIVGQGMLFSDRGDSGSLILTVGTNQPVGLLVGGGSSGTFACPLAADPDHGVTGVAAALGITRFVGTKP
jgi:hypothetical protein